MDTPKRKRGRPSRTTNSTIPEYVIELHLSGTTTTSNGATPLEALQALERPLKIITKGIVTVRHGDRVKELFFMPPALKRMFYPLAQVPIAKMLGMNM